MASGEGTNPSGSQLADLKILPADFDFAARVGSMRLSCSGKPVRSVNKIFVDGSSSPADSAFSLPASDTTAAAIENNVDNALKDHEAETSPPPMDIPLPVDITLALDHQDVHRYQCGRYRTIDEEETGMKFILISSSFKKESLIKNADRAGANTDKPDMSEATINGGYMDGSDNLHRYGSAALSPTALFTNSPLSITRPASSTDSIMSVGDEWISGPLLEMSERIRTSLRDQHTRTIPQNNIDELEQVLAALAEEEPTIKRVGINVIREARLDKLFEDLLDSADIKTWIYEELLDEVRSNASYLRHNWKVRFGEEWHSLDKIRLRTLTKEGALRHVVPEGQCWVVEKVQPIACLDVGTWWLNMYCAYRDGMVTSTDEIVAPGQHNSLVLPMLTGMEQDGPSVGLTKFIMKGSHIPHIKLMTCEGKPIHVIRGYDLDSKYAPLFGIRYDGKYRVQQWGHVQDQHTKRYTTTIILERCEGQKSVNLLRSIPSPAQIDDWHLYREIINKNPQALEQACKCTKG